METDPWVKDFVKAWARNILHLAAVKAPVLNELSKEGAAHQQTEGLYGAGGPLATPAGIREVAFRLALAEYQARHTAG